MADLNIWMNGKLVPQAQAVLPVNSAAVFYATNVFEGLRAVCVVVTERLPRHWFYEGAPLIQLDHWRALGELEVLDDPLARGLLHVQALSWWQERCSDAAVGAFLAARLNR